MTRPFGLAVLCAVVLLNTSSVKAQTVTPLNFEVADSGYSIALDRLIFVSGDPDRLHVYNPATNADSASVALPDAPVALSLSPDGLHAAVLHPFSVSYINLQAGVLEKTYGISATPSGSTSRVVLGPDYVYVLDSGTGLVSINLATGASSSTNETTLFVGATYDILTKSIYMCGGYALGKYDASTGPVTGQSTGPSGTTGACTRTWASQDGTKIYDDMGTVFNASTDPTVDMTYASSFLVRTSAQIQTLVTSTAASKVAYVDSQPAGGDGIVRLTDYNFLNPIGLINVPGFVSGSQSFAGHAKRVFFNSAGTYLYVLTQADTTSGLQYDQAVFSIPLQSPASCAVTVGNASLKVAGGGGIYAATVTADPACVYSATSNVDWITVSSGAYNSGNNTISFQVRQNLSGSRTGVVSIGSASVTVTQNAATSGLEMKPLSFNVVAADYSRLLDKIVMVAGLPNELHIYDGLSQSDQIVPLPAQPLSLSVTPDGTHAAVGHNGSISYVNLQTGAIEKTFTLSAQVADIAGAGNGYIYAPGLWNSFEPPMFSVNVASGVTTALAQTALSGQFTWEQVAPSGKYLYTTTAQFDISAGTASLVGGLSATCWKDWISNDGSRFFTSCGTVLQISDSPTFSLTEVAQLPTGPGAEGISEVNWAADSAIQQQTAVVTGQTFYNISPPVSNLQFYNDSNLALLRSQSFPSFLTAGTYYNAAGWYAFWSKDSSHLFVIVQEDTAANVLSGFAVLTVNTAPNPANCSFQVSGPTGTISAAGGTATFSVTASAAGCNWATDLGAASSLTLVSGSSGVGSGTVTVNVAENSALTAETFNLIIAGQTIGLTQDSACSYSLSPSTASFFSDGGSGAIFLTTGAGCPWTASPSSGLTLTSASSGVGSGRITYSVSPNTTSTLKYTGIDISKQVGGTTLNVTSALVNVSNTPPPPALRFVPVTPCRIADTRNATGAFGGPKLGAGRSRNFLVPASGCGIPSTAQAYALNVTAVPPAGLGYLTVWPMGQNQPFASTLNSDGRVKAVAAIIPAGTSGGVSVYATDPTDLVLDVNGYFVPATDPIGLAFYPVTPCRIMDTRNSIGTLGGPKLGSGQTRTVPIASSTCNIPATAAAYSLNYTVVPAGGLGFLASWPTGQAQPLVSTLNSGHSPTANAGIVPAGTNGSIQIYASDATDVILDINGYFAPPASGGLSLYALTPCRVVDTRNYGYPAGGIAATTPFLVSQQYGCSVPSNAQAYVMNLTVVPGSPLGYVSIWGDGQNQPVVSTLNDWDAVVTSNMAIAPTQYGSVNLFPSSQTQVILDVSGYFAP